MTRIEDIEELGRWTLHGEEENGCSTTKVGGDPIPYGETVEVIEVAGLDRIVATAVNAELESDETMETLRTALADPGKFTERVFGDPPWEGAPGDLEPMYVWQARAVVEAMKLR